MSAEVACTICAAPGPPTARWQRLLGQWTCSRACWEQSLDQPARPHTTHGKARNPPWSYGTGFGLLLRAWRLKRGWSCVQLAQECGLTNSYISLLEHNKRDWPRRVVVDRLADALWLHGLERAEFLVTAGYVPEHGTVVIENGRLIAVTGLLEAQPARDGAA